LAEPLRSDGKRRETVRDHLSQAIAGVPVSANGKHFQGKSCKQSLGLPTAPLIERQRRELATEQYDSKDLPVMIVFRTGWAIANQVP
jgi:hypothetical protein